MYLFHNSCSGYNALLARMHKVTNRKSEFILAMEATSHYWLALRELCRNRYYLVDMASDLERKITALLDQVFPKFEAQFSTIFGKAALAVLKQYPTAEKLARAQLGKLTQLLQTTSTASTSVAVPHCAPGSCTP